ncbi:MAG TPA: T9SS type A sorting domain-containing protein [Bacteroidia bacterium]|nr:T9SS type A sorting domain-containing protein [Bacteroidia bacterium]HNU32569.1 T9SS type A sorting domain-containing protein [Bacteroidia bacterium]
MKKAILVSVFSMIFNQVISQCTDWAGAPNCTQTSCQLITNGSFECLNYQITAGCDFQSNKTHCWDLSHSDPYIPSAPGGAFWNLFFHEAALIANSTAAYSTQQSMGIYQNVPITADKLYFLKFNYRVPSQHNYGQPSLAFPPPPTYDYEALDNFYIKLSDNNSFLGNCNIVALPSPANTQQIDHIQGIQFSTGMNNASYCVKANANYESLWFYVTQNAASNSHSTLVIDDVEMYEADAGTNQTVSCNSNIFLGTGCATIPGATYSWSPAIGLSSTTSLQTNLNTSLLSLGIHTYTLTVNYNGCIITDQVQITVQGPTVNLGPNQLICNGSSVNLNAGAGFANYQWSQPGTCLFGGPNMNACVTGNYCVTVTDANGCTASDCAYITISNMPNISILCTDPDICLGESVTLSANPACIGCTYSWSPGGATFNSITVSPAVTTNYSVLVTNAQGCFDFASQQVTVDQNCPPTSLCMHIDQTGNTDVGRRVTATSDGGFVAIGDISGAHNAADRDLYVVKYKPDMTVDFRKRIGDFVSGTTTYIYNESGFDVMPMVDGYLVAGTVSISTTNTNIILLKLDLNGNFLWRTTKTSVTNGRNDEARRIVKLSPLSGAPTRYYLVGHTNGGTQLTDFDILIFEFDPTNGSVIGTPQRFGDTGVNEFATDALVNEDRNAIIVSGFADVSTTNRDMFALKVSANLSWISSFYNGGTGTDVLNSVAQVGKDLFFAGATRSWAHTTTDNIYLMKVDESLFTPTSNKIYYSTVDEVANTIIKTSDNNLHFVGTYRSGDAVNMKIDVNLNQIWLYKSTLTRGDLFNGVTEQTDGLYAAVGMYNEGSNDDEFYISRIKPDGSSCCNAVWTFSSGGGINPNYKGGQRNGTLSSVKWGLIDNTGIEKYLCQNTSMRLPGSQENESMNEIEFDRGLKVIPNPSNGIFKLLFENELENITVNIYDLSGRKIKSISNLSTINLDLSELNDGIYLLEATGDGFSERQKIVIRK